MEYYKIEKKDGITTKKECNKPIPMGIGNNKKNRHLCWNNCTNGYADKCEKVYDERKKIISKYDFIKSGYQIIDEYNSIKSFVVTECDNYEEKKQEKLSMDEVNRIEKHDSHIKKLTR